MNKHLLVRNVSYQVDESQLTELLTSYGSVVSAEIPVEQRSGRRHSYAFVEMSSPSEAKAAITALNGTMLSGCQITIFPVESRSDEIITAIEIGDIERVKQLIAEGIEPNGIQPGTTNKLELLRVASRTRRDDIFFELVKAGADLQCKSGSLSLVHYIVGFHQKSGTRGMLEAVLKSGLESKDKLGEALYYLCGNPEGEGVDLLLEHGADLNHKCYGKMTPIVEAVISSHTEAVRLLLKAGAKANQKVPKIYLMSSPHAKKTLLEVAMGNKATEIVELLKAAGAVLPPPAKPAPVATSWKQIAKWIKKAAPGWKTLQKGATDADMANAQAALDGVTMPADFVESYNIHNGSANGQIIPVSGDISHYLMALGEVLQEWKMMKELAEGGEFDDGEPRGDERIQKVWWHTQWIPFTSNGAGDYLCIDMAPAMNGTVGQVINFNHEGGEHEVVASSLQDVLSTLARDLQDGAYEYSEDDGIA